MIILVSFIHTQTSMDTWVNGTFIKLEYTVISKAFRYIVREVSPRSILSFGIM